jgi:hypothetical protein
MNFLADKNSIKAILAILLGSFCIYSSFLFYSSLKLFANAVMQLHLSFFLMISLFILTMGGGLTLGSTLLREGKLSTGIIKYTFLYASYFLILQSILTMAPATSACKCVSWQDTISAISDWSRVEIALLFLFITTLVYFTNKYFLKPSPVLGG